MIDFGKASRNHTEKYGSPLFTAPEMLLDSLPNQSTDLWSLGCTLFYLWSKEQFLDTFHGRTCWSQQDAIETLTELNNKALQPTHQERIYILIQDKIPERHRPLLYPLLQLDPTKRTILSIL